MARTSPSEISAFAAIVPGTVLGQRYELQRQIGSGTYGEVWQAHDLLNGHLEVAVKLLRTELACPEVRQRFAQECSALELLISHPHIVAIRARGVYRDQDFMVLELLEGPSLADWLRTFSENRLPGLSWVMDLFVQICTGVAAAHRIKNPGPITHRDLKPENVMLVRAAAEGTSGFTAKLLDFGIARLGNLRRTAAGQQLGTPLYMAPEQAAGDEQAVGPWSDVFALGVMLVEMLTLRPTGPEESSLRGALVRRGPRGLREYLKHERPDIPDELWSVLLRALESKPSDRYPDADALLRAMTAAVPGYCPHRASSELIRAHKLRRSYLRALGPAGLAACVALSVAMQLYAQKLWQRAVMRLPFRPSVPGADLASAPPRVAPGSAAVRYSTVVTDAMKGRRATGESESAPADGSLPLTSLVQFRGGQFLMGSTWAETDTAYKTCRLLLKSTPSLCKRETYVREYPQRQVEVSPFAIERTEVTNRQLAAWLNSQKGAVVVVPDRRPSVEDDHSDSERRRLVGSGGLLWTAQDL